MLVRSAEKVSDLVEAHGQIVLLREQVFRFFSVAIGPSFIYYLLMYPMLIRSSDIIVLFAKYFTNETGISLAVKRSAARLMEQRTLRPLHFFKQGGRYEIQKVYFISAIFALT